jgi:hypothetical protein
MKSVLTKRFAVLIVSFMIAATFLLPTYGFAQGRGHGRGLSKKSQKFINGHDARDGRWDGRGPRPRLLSRRWYSGRQRHRDRLRLRHTRIHRVYIR